MLNSGETIWMRDRNVQRSFLILWNVIERSPGSREKFFLSIFLLSFKGTLVKKEKWLC